MPLHGEFPSPENGQYRLKNVEEPIGPDPEHGVMPDIVVAFNPDDEIPIGPERTDTGAIPLGSAPIVVEAAPAAAGPEAPSVDGARDSVMSALERDNTTDQGEESPDVAEDARHESSRPIVEADSQPPTDKSDDLLLASDTENTFKSYMQRRYDAQNGGGIDAGDVLDELEHDVMLEQSTNTDESPEKQRRIRARWEGSAVEKLTADERHAAREVGKAAVRATGWVVQRTKDSINDGFIRKTSDLARQGLSTHFDKVVSPPRPTAAIEHTENVETTPLHATEYQQKMDQLDQTEALLDDTEREVNTATEQGSDTTYNPDLERADIAEKRSQIREERWDVMRRRPRGADSVDFHDQSLEDMHDMYQENRGDQAKNQALEPQDGEELVQQRAEERYIERERDVILKAMGERNDSPDPPSPDDLIPHNRRTRARQNIRNTKQQLGNLRDKLTLVDRQNKRFSENAIQSMSRNELSEHQEAVQSTLQELRDVQEHRPLSPNEQKTLNEFSVKDRLIEDRWRNVSGSDAVLANDGRNTASTDEAKPDAKPDSTRGFEGRTDDDLRAEMRFITERQLRGNYKNNDEQRNDAIRHAMVDEALNNRQDKASKERVAARV